MICHVHYWSHNCRVSDLIFVRTGKQKKLFWCPRKAKYVYFFYLTVKEWTDNLTWSCWHLYWECQWMLWPRTYGICVPWTCVSCTLFHCSLHSLASWQSWYIILNCKRVTVSPVTRILGQYDLLSLQASNWGIINRNEKVFQQKKHVW